VKEAQFTPFFVITLISFAVYFNALSCGFVYDDMAQVLENPWIRDIRSVPDMFVKSVSGFVIGSAPVNYYRPFMHLIYLITYHLFGLTPWGFHLVNVLFHAGNSVLVFVLAARLFGAEGRGTMSPCDSRFTIHDSRLFAFLAALFATHPIHTEAVTWVAGSRTSPARSSFSSPLFYISQATVFLAQAYSLCLWGHILRRRSARSRR
jgi:hypothetical protein